MKQIPLMSRWGQVKAWALVDDDDYESLMKYTWRIWHDGYAGRMPRTNTGCGRKKVLMHRVINNTPDGYITDHINGNRIDNRRSNLRTCTVSQNGMNRRMKRNSTTGFKGVSRIKATGRFQTGIGVNGKKILLGIYDTAEEAHAVYRAAAKKYHGEFYEQHA